MISFINKYFLLATERYRFIWIIGAEHSTATTADNITRIV